MAAGSRPIPSDGSCPSRVQIDRPSPRSRRARRRSRGSSRRHVRRPRPAARLGLIGSRDAGLPVAGAACALACALAVVRAVEDHAEVHLIALVGGMKRGVPDAHDDRRTRDGPHRAGSGSGRCGRRRVLRLSGLRTWGLLGQAGGQRHRPRVGGRGGGGESGGVGLPGAGLHVRAGLRGREARGSKVAAAFLGDAADVLAGACPGRERGRPAELAGSSARASAGWLVRRHDGWRAVDQAPARTEQDHEEKRSGEAATEIRQHGAPHG